MKTESRSNKQGCIHIFIKYGHSPCEDKHAEPQLKHEEQVHPQSTAAGDLQPRMGPLLHQDLHRVVDPDRPIEHEQISLNMMTSEVLFSFLT